MRIPMCFPNHRRSRSNTPITCSSSSASCRRIKQAQKQCQMGVLIFVCLIIKTMQSAAHQACACTTCKHVLLEKWVHCLAEKLTMPRGEVRRMLHTWLRHYAFWDGQACMSWQPPPRSTLHLHIHMGVVHGVWMPSAFEPIAEAPHQHCTGRILDAAT